MNTGPDIISASDMQPTLPQLCRGHVKLVGNYNLFYKNIFYKNIQAEICEILRIF